MPTNTTAGATEAYLTRRLEQVRRERDEALDRAERAEAALRVVWPIAYGRRDGSIGKLIDAGLVERRVGQKVGPAPWLAELLARDDEAGE